MANPIQRDELISKDALDALKDMSHYLEEDKKNMDALMEGFKQYAAAVKEATAANSGNNEELAKALKKIDDLEKAYADLQKLMKENEATQKAVNAEKKKYIELSEKETSDLEVLQKVLKENENLWAAAARSINTTNMSYNAMKATLTELQKKMRTFEDEGKKNSEAAVEMANAIDRLKAGMKQADDAQRSLNIGVDNLRSALAKGTDEVKLYQLNAIQPATSSFNDMKERLGVLTEAYNKMSATQREGTEVGQLLGAKIKELNEGIKAYKQSLTETASATQQTSTAKRESNKLTEEEIKRIEELKAALASDGQARMDAVQGIDAQKMSYNELYQTYNALKDALNKMTVEERQNTNEGKAMTAQAYKLHETMNMLQQSTGIYTMQVGRYTAAFDKLRYSFAQILREAPSALNIEQFLLAISNNIPIFMDQAQAYIKGLKKDAEDLTQKMQSGIELTAEETEQLKTALNATATAGSKVAAVMKQMVRIGWINAITLAITFLLRKLPDIVEFFKNIFKHVTLASNEMNTLTAKAQVYSDVLKRTNDEIVKLDMIVERLKTIDKGTQEWKDAVAMVNDITKQNLDDVKTTKEEIEKVTEAYKEQAIQIATNDIIAEKIAKSRAQKALVKAAMEADTLEGAMELAGLKPDSKEGKKFISAWNDYNSKRPRQYTPPTEDWLKLPETPSDMNVPSSPVQLEAPQIGDKERIKVENIVRGQMQDMIDEEAENVLQQMIRPVKPLKKDKTGSGHTYSLKDVDFLESELLDRDAVIELESNFKRRLAMLVEQEEKERLVLKEKYEQELRDLEDNKKHGLITEAEYNEQLEKLNTNYNNLIKTNYEGNFEEMGVIQRKYWNKRNEVTAKEAEREEKEALKRDKKAIKDIEQQYEGLYKSVKKRVRTITDERAKNEALISNIHTAADELARLNELVIESDEDASGYTKRIAELTKQMEQWRNQMDFSKELALPGSFWELLQKKGAFDASPDTIKKIVGKFLPDMVGEMDEEQIESAFETITKNVGTATKEWYNTTIGYIQDLISAYVELANAKAEAAAEATEAAQEEYDKEKALLEAGYASRVEATWAEYQEKKAAQEKAEADAKAAAQTENDINEALTMGNLVSASAKIWEAFAAWPPVAIAALGTMWGSFAAAKIKAAEVSKYGEGGFEVLEGGSHASGHDIDLGIHNRRGRRMRAEGDEGIGIFSRKAMRHYGAESIEAMVDSVNRLEFEGNAAKRMNIERSIGMAVLSAPRTDLRRVESSLDKLVQYGSRNVVVEPDGSILEYRKNGVVRIKKA